MAVDRKKGGVLYLLTLSRYTLQKLYELHLQDELSTDIDTTYYLFGAEPYSFADSHYCSQPAPVREFGVLKTSLAERMRVFNSLKDDYRAIIEKYQDSKARFGPFYDLQGRYYKFESQDTMTVLIPVGRKELLEFPEESDTITIIYVHDFSVKFKIKVDEVGSESGNSCLIRITED
jgi:hypothetical protein